MTFPKHMIATFRTQSSKSPSSSPHDDSGEENDQHGTAIHPQQGMTPVWDQVFVREMNKISAEERDDLYAEMHGIKAAKPETSAFLLQVYVKLDKSLSFIDKHKRKAYDRAVFLKPHLDKDRSFQLMFLRACKYETAQAATRICAYFEHKRELFGEEKLVQDIALEDLNYDDLECMRQSCFTFLPSKDQSGRTILLMDVYNCHFRNHENYIRQIWYQIMCACEREDVQRNGVVAVVLALGECRVGMEKLYDSVSKTCGIIPCLPLRFVTTHFCTDDPLAIPTIKVSRALVGKEHRLRSRVHFGSRTETHCAMLSFGIRLPEYFTADNQQMYAETAEEYIQSRWLAETDDFLSLEVSCREDTFRWSPKLRDVLCGRGRPFHAYVGNVLLLERIEGVTESHAKATSKAQKSKICMGIVKAVQRDGGHFLKRCSDGWMIVDDKVARAKVSDLIRQIRLKQGKSNPSTPELPATATPQRNFISLNLLASGGVPNSSSRNSPGREATNYMPPAKRRK